MEANYHSLGSGRLQTGICPWWPHTAAVDLPPVSLPQSFMSPQDVLPVCSMPSTFVIWLPPPMSARCWSASAGTPSSKTSISNWMRLLIQFRGCILQLTLSAAVGMCRQFVHEHQELTDSVGWWRSLSGSPVSSFSMASGTSNIRLGLRRARLYSSCRIAASVSCPTSSPTSARRRSSRASYLSCILCAIFCKRTKWYVYW